MDIGKLFNGIAVIVDNEIENKTSAIYKIKELIEANHNHRPCWWFAQAPLGPITSRAYRLIESSFYCMMRPTAIEIAAWRILLFTSLDYLPF